MQNGREVRRTKVAHSSMMEMIIYGVESLRLVVERRFWLQLGKEVAQPKD